MLAPSFRGGFGTVYQVRQVRSGALFAMKCPNDSSLVKTDAQLHEMAALAALGEHPHVVSLITVTVEDGLPVFFMPWAQGGKLRDWIRKGVLTQQCESDHEAGCRLIDVGIQIARGLEHAHERGLVNADVKPSNVLVKERLEGWEGGERWGWGPTVMVADFGLSTECEPGGSDGVGGYTPGYAAPEQIQRQAVTEQTDVWSVGIVLLELVSVGKWDVQAARLWSGEAAVRAMEGLVSWLPLGVGEQVVGLGGKCLEEEPSVRIKMAEIGRAS